MHMNHKIKTKAGRVAATTLMAAAASLGLYAQQGTASSPAYPASNLQAALHTPANFFDTDSSSSSITSTDESATDAVTAERLTLSDSLQPPPLPTDGC